MPLQPNALIGRRFGAGRAAWRARRFRSNAAANLALSAIGFVSCEHLACVLSTDEDFLNRQWSQVEWTDIAEPLPTRHDMLRRTISRICSVLASAAGAFLAALGLSGRVLAVGGVTVRVGRLIGEGGFSYVYEGR